MPDPVSDPNLEAQRAEALRLGLFIGGVSLCFFLLVAAAMGWRIYALEQRKRALEAQEKAEAERAHQADMKAYKAAQAAQKKTG